jgi:Eukaryotic aspartyl protease
VGRWVLSTGLSSNLSAGHKIYDPTQSPTFQPLPNATFKTSFVEGSGASGPVGLDTVTIGGVSIPSQAFGLATQISQRFSHDTPFGGLLGLAFPSLSKMQPQKLTPWFWNAVESLEQPLFTVDLKHAEPGSYDFGWVDQNKYKGQITYVPADNSSGLWGIQVGGFAVGEKGQFSASPFAAVLGKSILHILFLLRGRRGSGYAMTHY